MHNGVPPSGSGCQPSASAASASSRSGIPNAGPTPGPWAWFGNQHGIYLATTHSGRTFIMGFDRMGMQGAQPCFRRDGIMVPASELVEFAVGDGNARGFKEGKADESVYRYDITGIDCPDARLIAVAPELLEVAESMIPANVCLTNPNVSDDVILPMDVTMGELRKIAAVIAKARGVI